MGSSVYTLSPVHTRSPILGGSSVYGGYGSGAWVAPGAHGLAPFPVYGFGYGYDPYASGRFVAPDLHNDPLFREQHRYDSHFPGRSQRQPRLQLNPAYRW